MMAARRVVLCGWADSAHIERWAEGLRARGHLVKLISVGGETLPGIDCVIYPARHQGEYIRRSIAAAREARLFKPDIVHVHYASAFGLWGLLSRHKPLVVSVWGSDITEFPSHWPQRTYMRYLLKRATWITTTGKALEAATTKLCPESARKLSVIPFGVSVPASCPTLPVAETIRICTLKWLHPVYGLAVLLRAIAEVVTSFPAISLSIAGLGPQEAELQHLIGSLRLENHVRLVGFIENRNAYTFIQEHDMMAMPSLQEGFGVAALEAAACGRPVIASRVGGIPEVVVDGVTGLLVPPNDPFALAEGILKLARDAALRKKLGAGGYQFVKERYNWEHSLDLMTNLYERLIAESHPRR